MLGTLTSAKNITYPDKHITSINCSSCDSGGNNADYNGDTLEVIRDENSSIGVLLAIKAVIQIIVNPVIGAMTTRFGYRLPLIFGTINLFVTAVCKELIIDRYLDLIPILFLAFAAAESYFSLFFARALQGVGSACVGVCGMSLIAHVSVHISLSYVFLRF